MKLLVLSCPTINDSNAYQMQQTKLFKVNFVSNGNDAFLKTCGFRLESNVALLHEHASFLFSPFKIFKNTGYQSLQTSAIGFLYSNGCLITIQGLREKNFQVICKFINFLSKKRKQKRENSWNPDAGKNTNYLPHFTRRQNQTKIFEPIKILCDTHAILYKHCATISQQFGYSCKLDLNRFGKIVNMLLNCEPKTLATLLGLNSNFYF